MQPLIDLFKQGLVLILLLSVMNYSPQRLRGLKDTALKPTAHIWVELGKQASPGDTWTWSR